MWAGLLRPHLPMLDSPTWWCLGITWARQKPPDLTSGGIDRRCRVFPVIPDPKQSGRPLAWQAARPDYGDPGSSLQEVVKSAAPSLHDRPWLVGRAPPYLCLAGCSPVDMKDQSKSGVGFTVVCSCLLGGEPIGNRHGRSILINRAGLKQEADASLLSAEDDPSLTSGEKKQ